MARNTTAHVRMITNPIPTRLKTLNVGLMAGIPKVMQYNANEGQNYMRANAPWTDRTGNARQGLFARVFKTGRARWTTVLWHSVDYGIWLELAHGRKYKIVEPAWRKTAQETMRDLQNLMRKLG